MIRKQCPLPFGGHEELVGGATRSRIAAFWTWVLTTIRLRLQSTRAVLDTLGFDAVTNFENDWQKLLEVLDWWGDRDGGGTRFGPMGGAVCFF
ncbi:hypothetical protein Zmor_019232 [Zophobas morio]|uniref:Uncharacterized protein n=1 Tax=Zophobas morio TaxID=2755281 RepID=A0AA38M8M7_9CUCU|nr:hypothetical protein Zmor_019232 [Zophobas morio]